ncbi:MAG: hypothetical protein II458_04425 [Oscillospiraceae bacterium]|nr:hypothetical protein [Oscillospiraceae bacterium]
MKTDRLQDALGAVRDDYILDAHSEKKTVKKPWLRWGTLAACLCLAAVCAFGLPKLLNRGTTPDPVKPYAPDIGQYTPVEPGPDDQAPVPGPDDQPIPIPGPEPDPPGPGTVIIDDPQPVEPQDWQALFNQVDTAPDGSHYVSLTGRPVTEAELNALIPEGLPSWLKLESAYANFVGSSDEPGGHIYPEDARLDSVELQLLEPNSGRKVRIGIWPAGQTSVFSWAAQFDPTEYEATSFAAGDVTLFQCEESVWTYFTCGDVSYSVGAEASAKDEFCRVVSDILMSVETPDLSIIVPNP